ncbi:hypothetical protein Q8F55_000223 [Vanrija albida]|uniref:Carbohydrate kinase PfkB domain-containing protein n=1 Tax=Vanrija albida TaxID=181172 RepID=A0ABR3QCN0_9TREE
MGSGLILASIGTVGIDILEAPPAPSAAPAVASPGVPALSPSLLDDQSRRSSAADVLLTPLSSPHPPLPAADAHGPAYASGTIGGGALYALIGARMWIEPGQLRTLIDAAPRATAIAAAVSSAQPNGSAPAPAPAEPEAEDFPQPLEAHLSQYGRDMWAYNRQPGLRAVSAYLWYDGDGKRNYTPIVSPTVRTAAQIVQSPLFGAEYLHVSPPYAPSHLRDLLDSLAAETAWRPKVVFEPHPEIINPGEREALEAIAHRLHVLSPNHEELLKFYGIATPERGEPTVAAVESVVEHLLDVGVGEDGGGIIVVRCGSQGACVATRAGGTRWIPAYLDTCPQRVKDVTGAGNAFIGGFVAGLHYTSDAYEAGLYATVSASFVVEQRGLPSYTPSPALAPLPSAPLGAPSPISPLIAHDESFFAVANGRAKPDPSVPDMWNDEAPQSRLAKLRARVAWA